MHCRAHQAPRSPTPATFIRVRRAGILALLCLALCPAAPARAGGWRWPVRGPLFKRFHYGSDPFAAGQHRGIEIGAPAGTPVRSACAGSVTFTGAPPRAGRTVTVACGALAATYLHLASISVRTGSEVSPGDRLGAVGAGGRLYFGVRRRGRRFAYLDPLRLLAGGGRREPVPLLPRPANRRVPGPGARFGPAPRPMPLVVPGASRVIAPLRPGRARAPLPVWIGLGLAAVALPGLGLRRRLRRARSTAVAASES